MRWAKQIVAMRPDISCRICRSSAEVGEALALPTPTPVCWVGCQLLAFWLVYGVGLDGIWTLKNRSGGEEACY
jgi:hypothetical protein